MEKLISLKNEINDLLGIDISSRRRTNEYAFGRFVFVSCAMQLYKPKLREIGAVLDRDHATIIYAKKSLKYMPKSYQDIAKRIVHARRMTEGNVIQYMNAYIAELEQKIANGDHFTENEKIYRTLNADQKRRYDERVTQMLKMI
jgi:hypothetical protein